MHHALDLSQSNSAIGTNRTTCDVRNSAAIEGQADMTRVAVSVAFNRKQKFRGRESAGQYVRRDRSAHFSRADSVRKETGVKRHNL
jgi:hypothetical protein